MQESDNINTENTASDSQVYELGYLLVPTILEENIVISYDNLKEAISSFAGVIISDEMPKTLNLAYPMQKVIYNVRHKFSTAYFGWIKFTMNKQKILEFKRQLDLDSDMIRFLLLKTVKENTVAAKRFFREEVNKRPFVVKKNTEENALTSMDKEMIDKEIDALVVS